MDREGVTKAAIDGVLAREGGYVNRPEDRGGPTNRGITARTLGDWRKLGRPATVAEVLSSTEEEARAIYKAIYVNDSGAALVLEPNAFELVLDCAVHHGPRQAVRFIQRALGLEPDGILGTRTRTALAMQTRWGHLYRRVLAERFRFLGRWIIRDTTDADHDGVTDTAELAAGLLARVASFVEREVA